MKKGSHRWKPFNINTLHATKMVAGEGIEPPTKGFSIPF